MYVLRLRSKGEEEWVISTRGTEVSFFFAHTGVGPNEEKIWILYNWDEKSFGKFYPAEGTIEVFSAEGMPVVKIPLSEYDSRRLDKKLEEIGGEPPRTAKKHL